MDQVKIGQFIKTIRKEKNLTQREIAERMSISEKTVSKWETGNGLPEVSLMLPLCKLLEISVNELLSGERLDEKEYYNKAEENIMNILQEKAEAKKKIVISVIIVLVTLLAGATLSLVGGFVEMQVWLRCVLQVIAGIIVVTGICLVCVLDRDAGAFECSHCGERFVPSMKEYIFTSQFLTKRKLKCPKCGKTSYCKKVK